MATRRIRSPKSGKMVDAEVVEITEISDRPIVMTLADGTTLRLKTDVIEVVRFNGEWDPEGNPLYNVKSGSLMVVLESPENLRKGLVRKGRE